MSSVYQNTTLLMAAVVTSLIAVLIRHVFLWDVAGADSMMQRDAGLGHAAFLPPVIYNQTLGPLYIRNHNNYYWLWCNGTEGATVSWKYNDKNISDPEVNRELQKTDRIQFIFDHGGSQLYLYDQYIKVSDAPPIHGYLQCFVTNAQGSTFGDKVFVRHPVLELVSNEALTTLPSTVGDTVTLSCARHIAVEPRAEVMWGFTDTEGNYNDWDPQGLPGVFCNQDKTVCVISHVKTTDAGEYKCTYKITGKVESQSKRFYVNVESSEYPNRLHPLNLISHVSSPSQMDVKAGSTAELQCAFRGIMNQTILWARSEGYDGCGYQDVKDRNDTLTGVNKYSFHSNGTRFHISNFSTEDEGYYLCIADNGYDQYSHRVKLTMVAPPVLTEKIYGVETYLGGTVRLNCSVLEAVPPVRVTWWVNTDVVTDGGLRGYTLEDDGATLALYNASTEDTSGVTCNVSNDIGSMLGHRYISVRNMTAPTTEPPTVFTTVETTEPNRTTDPVSVSETTEFQTDYASSASPTSTSDVTSGNPDTESQSEAVDVMTTATETLTSETLKKETTPYHDVTSSEKGEQSSNQNPYKIDKHQADLELKGTLSPDPPPWHHLAWPWVIIVMSVFVSGLGVGILGTRCYIYRRRAERNEPSQEPAQDIGLIINKPSISAYNKGLARNSAHICSASSPEAESMMHSEIQMETVT